MTTRSCTDKVDCLRVTISSVFTRIMKSIVRVLTFMLQFEIIFQCPDGAHKYVREILAHKWPQCWDRDRRIIGLWLTRINRFIPKNLAETTG